MRRSAARERGDVRRVARRPCRGPHRAAAAPLLSTATRSPPHPSEHAEDVQHRLVDAVRGEIAEAGEVGLVLELERPGHRAAAG